MTARSDIPPDSSATAKPDVSPGRKPFTVALGFALLGALLIGLGPRAGLVTPTPEPAYRSWPVLFVLALLVPALALWFRRRGRSTVGAAVLVGPAALAPGRLALDTQLAVDASMAARPELLRPERLQPFAPTVGLWLLLAGHLAVLLAGLLAVRSISRESAEDGMHRQGLLAVVLCAGVIAAVGMLMAPFSSDDPYLVPYPAVDAPVAVLVGSLLLAVAVPVTAGVAVGSTDPDFARGGLLGLALGVAGVVVPALLVSTLVNAFHYGWGPVFGAVAAIALAVLAVPAGRARHPADGTTGELRLPTLSRLHALAGGLAVLSGLLCLVAALSGQLDMPEHLDDPAPYPARLLWPAGAVLILLGLALFAPSWAARVRPALSVAWAAVPLAGAAVLDAVFTATQIAGAQAGPGAWAAGGAIVAAVSTAVVSALAGSVERDDVDLTEIAMRRYVLPPALAALVLGAGAFSFPVLTAPDYTPPGVFAAFGTTSWGLLTALVAVVGGAVLAPLSRPARGAALLAGAALVVAVRLVEYPLTAGRMEGSTPGIGLWFGVACFAVLVVTAVLAGSRRESTS